MEVLFLEWRTKAKSIFKSPTIRRLFLNKYSGKDLSAFQGMTELKELSLAGARIVNLSGLNSVRLSKLGVYETRGISSIESIENQSGLQSLEVNGCRKISSVETVSSLTKLESLHLCDDSEIESLLPVSNLMHLRELLFYGDTNITDGKISFLRELTLKKLVYQKRRHYDDDYRKD